MTVIRAARLSGGISGTTLKWLALLAMTLDHIGMLLLPNCIELRLVGRLAYPVFAYMIAEGCWYTKRKGRYFLSLSVLGLVCSAGSYAAVGNTHQPIFITFALSIAFIYGVEYCLRRRPDYWKSALAAVFMVVGAVLLYNLCRNDFSLGFSIDYGFCGIMTPVVVWLSDTKAGKLIALTFGLSCIALDLGGIQIFSLAAVAALALYSGKRGRGGGKYFFYVYYPAHLVLLYGLAQWLNLS